MRSWLWVSLLVCLPYDGFAACPAGALPKAIAARLDKSVIGAIQGPLLAELPSSIPMPTEPFNVLDASLCIDPTIITPIDGDIQFTVREVDLRFADGAVELEALLDFSVDATLDMLVSCWPDAVCPAEVDATDVRVFARMEPSVEACVAAFPMTVVTVEVDTYDVSARLVGCGVTELAVDLIIETFRDFIVAYAVAEIEATLQTTFPEWLATFTQDMFGQSYEVLGMELAIAPEDIAVDVSGIELSFRANALPAQEPPEWCGLAGQVLPDEPLPTADPRFSAAMVSVAAARPFLERVMRSAWLAGWLCFDSRDYDLDLGSYLTDLLPGATLDFRVAAHEPPSLSLMPDGEADLELDVSDLWAEITLGVGGGEPSVATASISAQVVGDVGVDAAQRAVIVTPIAATSSGLAIDIPGTSFGFSQSSLQGFIEHLVLPSFAENIGALPVTSGLFTTSAVAINLDAVRVTATHARVDLALWAPDPRDLEPPSTMLVSPPADPSPAEVTVTVRSMDAGTPSAFLRHVVTIDGEPAPEPLSGETFTVGPLAGGLHHLGIAALDLNDNQDPSPLELEVFVDDLPPVLAIRDTPAGVTNTDTVIVSVVGSDNVAAAHEISYRYTVGLVRRDNEPDVTIAEGELGRDDDGRSITALRIPALPDGKMVRVTFFGRDTAGNEAHVQTGFVVELAPEMGCQAAAASPLWALLAALPLVLRLRRRR